MSLISQDGEIGALFNALFRTPDLAVYDSSSNYLWLALRLLSRRGAEPGFLLGRSANPPVGKPTYMIIPNFRKKKK